MKAVKSYEKRLEKDLQLITQKPDTMDNMAIFSQTSLHWLNKKSF